MRLGTKKAGEKLLQSKKSSIFVNSIWNKPIY